jgi:hypothetical protein
VAVSGRREQEASCFTVIVWRDQAEHAAQFLTPKQQAASLAWVLAGLGSNGGFEAWVESLGQRTLEAVAGLRLMGADGYAGLLEQLARLYPTLGAADADTRLSAMDGWGDREVGQLHQLTQQFFELQRHPHPTALYLATV